MTELFALNIRDSIPREIWADFLLETPEERRKQALRYHFPQDEKRCICAYALLRYVYTRGTGRPVDAARLLQNPWGKPYLAGEPGRFNLSHAGDWVVCAWSGGEVGADVESLAETDPSVAGCALHPAELRQLAAEADPQRQRELFCDYWTLKESYMKFRGMGVSLPPTSFQILLEGAGARLASSGGESPIFSRYRLDERHRAAVCSEDREKGPLYRLTPKEIHNRLQNAPVGETI